MKIDYTDIILLNAELSKRNTRYHLHYKNENTVCIEPPGECCLTDDMTRGTKNCIEEYYREKNMSVHFSDDGLYFYLDAKGSG